VGAWDAFCAAIALFSADCDCGGPGQEWSDDCNENIVPDECEIADGRSSDCNANDIPDDCEPDADGDQVIDACDDCPEDPKKSEPGQCGCGVADTDTDGDIAADCVDADDDNDGVLDAVDMAPLDPHTCEDVDGDGCDDCVVGKDGFGPLPDNDVSDDGSDGDGDGACDTGDGCPLDPNKQNPGECGCGITDADGDLDTIPDCRDVCPGEDDRVDEDRTGTPDCLEPTLIPTLSGWGLLVLGLFFLIGGKISSRRQASTSR